MTVFSPGAMQRQGLRISRISDFRNNNFSRLSRLSRLKKPMDATTTYQKFAQFYDAYVQDFAD
ncbi:MAG: hypothetical protein JXA81_01345, partial [Sedimentisphaerales bacterium]|nr:hypothetical protein [Sedimentisphaerales bacterium]